MLCNAYNYSSEVHKVINIEGTSVGSNYLVHYHSNTNVPNGNWLWFQAYTSVIHGAKGIWFWDFNSKILTQEFAKEVFEEDWNIYPNPSNGLFHVNFNNANENAVIEVYNQMGKLIEVIDNVINSEYKLDLSEYSTGIYFVVLKSSRGIQTKKIQKIK